MKKFIHQVEFMFGCLLFISLLSGCGQSGAADTSGKINVVAAEDFYGEVAKAVGANHVAVTSIIDKPSVDPHDYEPTTGTARSVSQAKLIISNGLGYDGWIDKLVQNSEDQTVVRVGEGLMNKKDGDNEHLWYQPDTMPKLADDLAEKFGKIDPKHASVFKENAKKYIQSIKPVKDEIALLSKKSDGRRVDVSEPVFDYTLQAIGYRVANTHFSLAVDQGSDPSPKDIAGMQADIKGRRIAFFVCNTQNIDPMVKKMVALSKQYHVPVVSVTETLPKGKDYKAWMMDQLKQVEAVQNK